MTATPEWIEKYQQIKAKLQCSIDLDAYFTAEKIGNMPVDILHIGTVNISTGQLIACDPLVDLEDCKPFIQTVPVGQYPMQICVVPSEEYGDRYAAVKMTVRDTQPLYYDCAMIGNENLDGDIEDGGFWGFGVDAGMGCLTDAAAQKAFQDFWQKKLAEDVNDEIASVYDDVFCDLLDENYQKYPKYQREGGDWLNWTVPNTDFNIPIFTSGWGDGYYPCYFGYDKDHQVCAVYIWFFDIEETFND